jgi:phosphoribosylaminoimidazolecarboxamide formyltransferase / IMP cyclohydrolase
MSDLKKMYTTVVEDPFPAELVLRLGETELAFAKRTWTIDGQVKGLRYGENPDQPAALYAPVSGRLTLGGVEFRGPGQGLICAATEEHMLQAGKHPGKTNCTDVDNGVNILQYLAAKPAVVILKHNNPCGAAWSEAGLETSFAAAYAADRIAAFGGAVVVNRTLDLATAKRINAVYMEVVAAPDYEPAALELLTTKKNLRIFKLPGLAQLDKLVGQPFLDIKSLADGGLVLQFSFRNRILTVEDFLPAEATDKEGTTLVARAPTSREAEDLLFAWAVEAGVTSNSVVFAKNGATVAIGTGEQDRVGVVELTVHKAKTKYADLLAFTETGLSLYELTRKADSGDAAAQTSLIEVIRRTEDTKGGLVGSVLVSDGFFPFRDGVDQCLAAGVTAIAQPGGSVRDMEAIVACNEAVPQVAMVFTGQRSFRH